MRLRICITVLAMAFLWPAHAQLLQPAEPQPAAKPIVFQPALFWKNSPTTYQGTGFFAKTERFGVVAVTSAHFLNFDGPPLLGVAWLDVPTGGVVALFNTSVGKPGTGINPRANDYSGDYLIMPAPGTPEAYAQVFDDRPPEVNDRVWLPNKDEKAVNGYRRVEGVIVEIGATYLVIEFDKPIELQSQSGSPFINIDTGAVVGVLSSAGERDGKQIVIAAKSEFFVRALTAATNTPPLQRVIGKD